MTKANALNRTSAGAVFSSLHEGNAVDGRKVDASIKWIGQTGPKLDATIHATAVACIYLSMPHVDGGHNCAARAVKLCQTLKELNKSARLKTLMAWFHAYSNIRLRIEKGGSISGGVLKPTQKSYVEARPGDAMAKPFWTVEEADTDPKAFDDAKFASAVQALIKRAKGENATLDDAGRAALADLEAIAAKLPKKDKADA